MIDFVRKHRTSVTILSIVLILTAILIFAGRSIGDAAIEQISRYKARNKAVCTVNPKNATQIVYKGATYQILNETVDDREIRAWNGVLRKIAILDGRLRVIKEIKSGVSSASQVAELEKDLPHGAKYVVIYFNTFSIKGTNERRAIAVNLDRGTYKAVQVNDSLQNEQPVRFDKDSSYGNK